MWEMRICARLVQAALLLLVLSLLEVVGTESDLAGQAGWTTVRGSLRAEEGAMQSCRGPPPAECP